jgi:hypothetical protein
MFKYVLILSLVAGFQAFAGTDQGGQVPPAQDNPDQVVPDQQKEPPLVECYCCDKGQDVPGQDVPGKDDTDQVAPDKGEAPAQDCAFVEKGQEGQNDQCQCSDGSVVPVQG